MKMQGKLRKFIAVALIGLGTGCLAGIIMGEHLQKQSEPSKQLPASNEPLKKLSLEEQAAVITAELTAEQKVGQLIMLGISGAEMDEAAKEILAYCQPGGIILFDRNLVTPLQVKNLIKDLNEINHRFQPVSLFIAIDEEGGRVARMKDYLTVNPSAQSIGAGNNRKTAADYAAKTAIELKSLGINVNFAPVADLGLPGERSYGTDSAVVADFVQSVVRAYERAGIISAVKHFPGIGKADVDLHIDSTQITAPRTVLEREDFLPFRAAIDNLNNDAFMVMVSHLKYSALDKVYPASLSAKIMNDLLREQMGYKGLVITDDMEMGGAANLFSFRELGYMAIKGGADIVLVCHEYEHQREVYEGILSALQDGRLDEAVVDEKVRRIIRIKLKYLSE